MDRRAHGISTMHYALIVAIDYRTSSMMELNEIFVVLFSCCEGTCVLTAGKCPDETLCTSMWPNVRSRSRQYNHRSVATARWRPLVHPLTMGAMHVFTVRLSPDFDVRLLDISTGVLLLKVAARVDKRVSTHLLVTSSPCGCHVVHHTLSALAYHVA